MCHEPILTHGPFGRLYAKRQLEALQIIAEARRPIHRHDVARAVAVRKGVQYTPRRSYTWTVIRRLVRDGLCEILPDRTVRLTVLGRKEVDYWREHPFLWIW